MLEPTSDKLDGSELAARAGTSPARVAAMRDAGLLEVDHDERYGAGDVHLARILDAFLTAGISLEALASATQSGVITFAYYGDIHPESGPMSARTYAEVTDELGERATLLGPLFLALGLPEPDPGSRLQQADERLILTLVELVTSTGSPDLALRIARHLSDAIRRATDAMLEVYGEAVQRAFGSIPGIPPADLYERSLEPWSRYARMAPEFARWLTARHLSSAIDAFSVTQTEAYLAANGYLAPRDREPPAISFVDLSDFTRVTEERGDDAAARLALAFADLALRIAPRHRGRVVKLLGDGVLLRFGSATDAVEATLTLLAEVVSSGLGSGHAGVAAGPIVERDGDVFGTVVNLASRIAASAQAGALLTTTDAAGLLPASYAIDPLGPVRLKGLVEPIEIVRVSRAPHG